MDNNVSVLHLQSNYKTILLLFSFTLTLLFSMHFELYEDKTILFL